MYEKSLCSPQKIYGVNRLCGFEKLIDIVNGIQSKI